MSPGDAEPGDGHAATEVGRADGGHPHAGDASRHTPGLGHVTAGRIGGRRGVAWLVGRPACRPRGAWCASQGASPWPPVVELSTAAVPLLVATSSGSPAMSESVSHVVTEAAVPSPHSSWSASRAVLAAGLAQPVSIAASTTHGPTRRRRARLGTRWLVVMQRIVRIGAGAQHRPNGCPSPVPSGHRIPAQTRVSGARRQRKCPSRVASRTRRTT